MGLSETGSPAGGAGGRHKGRCGTANEKDKPSSATSRRPLSARATAPVMVGRVGKGKYSRKEAGNEDE